jgi:excisionase family DNA binding protein
MLSMKEAAELLRVSVKTVQRMVSAGEITSVKLHGRRVIPYEILKRDVLAQAG